MFRITRNPLFLVAMLGLLLFLSACSGNGREESTATLEPTAAATATLGIQVQTEEPTATLEPTETPVPAYSPTPNGDMATLAAGATQAVSILQTQAVSLVKTAAAGANATPTATLNVESVYTATPTPGTANANSTPEGNATGEMKVTAWQSRNRGEPKMAEILGGVTLSQACNATGADGKLLIDRIGYNPIDPQCAEWAWGSFPAQALEKYLRDHGKLTPEGVNLVLDKTGMSVKIPGWMGFTTSEIKEVHAILGSWGEVAIAGRCKADQREGNLFADGSDWYKADFIVYLAIYAPNQFPWNLARDGRPCAEPPAPTATPSN